MPTSTFETTAHSSPIVSTSPGPAHPFSSSEQSTAVPRDSSRDRGDAFPELSPANANANTNANNSFSNELVIVQLTAPAIHSILASSTQPPADVSPESRLPNGEHDVLPSTQSRRPTTYRALASIPINGRSDLFVTKRDGYDTYGYCLSQLTLLSKEISTYQSRQDGIDSTVQDSTLKDIVSRVIRGVQPSASTFDLQGLLALISNSFTFVHPDYGILAGRLFAHRIHKATMKSFSAWVSTYGNGDRRIVHPDVVAAVSAHGDKLDQAIVHARDCESYFYSLQTMYKFYLLRFDGEVVERPQFMYMRVAVAIHGTDLARVLETYELLSTGAYSPATPILYNASTIHPNLASCFICQPWSGSTVPVLGGLVHDVAEMWSVDGGVGVNLGSFVAEASSPGYQSSGPVPILRVLDAYASLVSSNRWRRSSSVTAYLPIWHSDVLAFAVASTQRSSIPSGLKRVFPAMWIPDVFFQRLQRGTMWSLFDPDSVPTLFTAFGDEFMATYEEYEASGIASRRVDIAALWAAIVDSERETGTPFLLMQDNINRRNNEAHLGVVRSSNLCTEIVQYSAPDRPAVCTLASVSLPHFVCHDGRFDFAGLHRIAKLVVSNTDRCIDISTYPNDSIAESVKLTRALGVGVQGLADALMLMRIPFNSPEGRKFNIDVFETLYHASLESSCDIAEAHGPYLLWAGSPASQGVLQVDMWNHTPSARYDFDSLRARIRRFGLRNSVLTALMPTASTSKLLGNFESFEPYSSTALVFRTSSGDFPLISPHLVRELQSRGLWDDATRQQLLENHSSIQGCSRIPDDIKAVYKTIWDIDPTDIIDMAVDRSPFIDQSQSLTLSVRNPTPEVLKRLMIRAWRKGLKTGLYYLRTLHPTFSSSTRDAEGDPSSRVRFDCCA
ncbi:hypothetical protein GSI_12239 [Ganoderma sinense ZZ0214-1]|uniref:Ribonucleoside-diphosphate reductase n=1 Tax=Ganoderma sinense ZZ0214-1 TaxID=1077348 RepID=A0A2G8RY90_9APHY|nr:hypothetical protein GSI_12239 [Ganoderma sinense ZZ0214-1]